ncbi:Transcription factor WhiB [Amycolatopsis saalfeldensis]|uniref:Transcriptional regulator WhiB n=1 Tax=Amycolatopsis saalfeldensis TaxID=394193 RepID=A0A1H8YP30_9PSEU|nr:Transcription factor WhiB [Amycolatopsis saalfeldensis]
MVDVSRIPPPLTTLWDWQLDAACRDIDSTMFFHPEYERGAEKTSRDSRAKAICRRCPVIEACRGHALAVHEPYGIWGGLTAAERTALLGERGSAMGEFRAAATVSTGAEQLFEYLSTVSNLPLYLAPMTSATPKGGLWFRVDRDTRRIEWGSEGLGGYHGFLTITSAGDETELRVRVTRRPGRDVQRDLDETLATIKRLAGCAG